MERNQSTAAEDDMGLTPEGVKFEINETQKTASVKEFSLSEDQPVLDERKIYMAELYKAIF